MGCCVIKLATDQNLDEEPEMANDLIDERGRLSGTRITVYNLLPYFLDMTVTEAAICQLYELQPEQVAAARAFVLNHADSVLAQHLRIEERIAAGNPPEVIEQAKRIHATFLSFKDWLATRAQADAQEHNGASGAGQSGSAGTPSFREWLAQRDSGQVAGS